MKILGGPKNGLREEQNRIRFNGDGDREVELREEEEEEEEHGAAA